LRILCRLTSEKQPDRAGTGSTWLVAGPAVIVYRGEI
jgi:hypothetical protein